MIVQEAERRTAKGERIVKIASSFFFVGSDTPVRDILDELHGEQQKAIAVVTPEGEALGIIVSQDLVEMLGKPFGRDLLLRQDARDIMREVPSFPYDEYIEETAKRVGADLEKEANTHYLLVDENRRFCGIFSSKDILLHAMAEHRREMDIACMIQERLVPPYDARRNDSISITCSSVMAQGVGGDYYFVKEYRSGRWFFCLCDISGKGISAAIITAVLSGFMCNADFDQSLEELVAGMNRVILDAFRLEKYLTGFFARFDESTGALEYCDMGHSWFFVIDGDSVQRVCEEADNCPVGIVDSPDIVTRLLRIAPGTILLLVSDGIIEQMNRQGAAFPLAEIGRCVGKAIRGEEDLVRAKIRILESFFSFKKDVPQHDDISLLLFHYRRPDQI